MESSYVISVPGGLTRTRAIVALAQRIRTYGKNVQLQAYDTVQGLQWNGGRIVFSHAMKGHVAEKNIVLSDVTIDNLHEAISRARFLNDHGIPFNLTLNNVMESLNVEDEDGNTLLQGLENETNLVTVATRSLAHHVKTHYPRFKRVASVCHLFTKLEDCRQACASYDLTVLLPFIAYRPDYLAALPKEKIAFILNDTCAPLCRRKEHYEHLSRCSLAGNVTRQEQERNVPSSSCLWRTVPGYCKKMPDDVDQAVLDEVGQAFLREMKLVADRSQLPGHAEYAITSTTRRKLVKGGLTHFKLQGRGLLDGAFESQVAHFLETFVRDEL